MYRFEVRAHTVTATAELCDIPGYFASIFGEFCPGGMENFHAVRDLVLRFLVELTAIQRWIFVDKRRE